MARKRDCGEKQLKPAADRPVASPHDPPADLFKPKRTAPATQKLEPLLTFPEVAEILKCSVKQVRRYTKHKDPRKRLACIDPGRGELKRVDPLDLEAWIRVHRRP